MKKNKNKLFMGLSVLIISFLISTSYLNVVSTKALLDTNENYFTTDSFDRSTWEWNATEVVSTGSNHVSGYSSQAVDSEGNVHVTWYDYGYTTLSGGDVDIFYKRWNATTSTWMTIEVVSTESTGESLGSSLFVDLEGNIHISWEDGTNYTEAGIDYDIFYKRWNSTTLAWTTTEVVSTESTDASRVPSLAVDFAGNVHIMWYDVTDYGGSGGDGDIFYKRWNSTTLAWTTTEVVSTENIGGASSPSLYVDSFGNIHVAWNALSTYGGSGVDTDVFYKRWNATTLAWITTEVVSTESTGGSAHPSLAVDSSQNVHVAWYDYTNYASSGTDVDIFYKQWNATTLAWNSTEVISTVSTNFSSNPSLSVDSEEDVHIVWSDETDYNGSGNEYDIFYRRWDTNSSIWTLTEVISTESTAGSITPSIAVDSSGYVHVSWTDSTDYNGADNDLDIFYKLSADSPTKPELEPIEPNPTDNSTIFLNWNDVFRATSYYVYRSTSNILSVEGLLPIATTYLNEYIDVLPSEGIYYYVIVAENFAGNSTLSNCWSIVYIPVVNEFGTISSLILTTFTFLIVILITRKKKLK